MSPDQVIHEVMQLCEATLVVQGQLVGKTLGEHIELVALTESGEFTVSCKETTVDPSDQGTGDLLRVRDYKIPQQLEDHTTVLDACLATIARSPLALIDFIADGDNHDCEVMFAHVDKKRRDFILKVR